MEKIDRFEFFGGGDEIISPDGDWVRCEDHERVVARMQDVIDNLQNQLECCWEEAAGEDA